MQPAFVCLLFALCQVATDSRPASAADAEILAGADARIEKFRKADVVLTVTLPNGRPAEGVTVRIEQTSHAFLFGSNITQFGRCRTEAQNRAYEDRFAELLNYATAAFFWWSYEPQRGKPDYTSTEKVAAWCRGHGVKLKGHTLVWNALEPKWLPDSPEEIRRLQLVRVADCVGRFAEKVDYWDVANEVTHWDRPLCLNNSRKLSPAIAQVGKIPFVCQAFEAARRANPKATLLINDYIAYPDGPATYARETVSKLVDKDGRRVYDAIGIQCHQHTGAWTARYTWDACERLAKFGVPLHFTETTILSGENGWELREKRKGFDWVTTPEGEARQAREVVRFYTVLFSHPAVEAITWWDFSDQDAWQGAPAGLVRSDMTPKPAYRELLKLIRGRWWTKTAGRTDAQGQVRFRGFCGDYAATITVGGRESRHTFTVAKGSENRVDIKLVE